MRNARPLLVALTGSIGMGKSTTAAIFQEEGAAVWDADGAVHRLYQKNGAAISPLVENFGQDILDAGGNIDRQKLSALVLNRPDQLKKLEQIIHPLVSEDRAKFIAEKTAEKAKVVILDIPLLFETGGQSHFDISVVVSCPASLQRQRVLARPNMTEAKLEAILARQMPDEEKRKLADFIIDTSQDLDHVRQKVRQLMSQWQTG